MDIESLVESHVLEVLDANILLEVVDAGEYKATLAWSRFYITSVDSALQGSAFRQLLGVCDGIISQ